VLSFHFQDSRDLPLLDANRLSKMLLTIVNGKGQWLVVGGWSLLVGAFTRHQQTVTSHVFLHFFCP